MSAASCRHARPKTDVYTAEAPGDDGVTAMPAARVLGAWSASEGVGKGLQECTKRGAEARPYGNCQDIDRRIAPQ